MGHANMFKVMLVDGNAERSSVLQNELLSAGKVCEHV